MTTTSQLQEIKRILPQMEDALTTLRDIIHTTLTSVYGFDVRMEEEFPIGEDITDDEIINLFSRNDKYLSQEVGTTVNNLLENKKHDEVYALKEDIEYLRHVATEISNSIKELKTREDEKNKLQQLLTDASDKYIEYLNSEEYKQKKVDSLNKLREEANNMEDEYTKNKILNQIKSIEKSDTLEFLIDRLQTIGKKEIDSIVDSFFNSKKSETIMSKFATRMPRFGYNKDIYKMYFNIEEKFLPEEYHVYNNIFLFHVMRFISYADAYNSTDSSYVASILLSLYNLNYHKFPTQEKENEFIEFIKTVDSFFFDYKDKFVANNTTSPNHPARIQREHEYEVKRRMMTIASLENEGLEVDTTLETEELRNQLQTVIDLKQNTPVLTMHNIKRLPLLNADKEYIISVAMAESDNDHSALIVLDSEKETHIVEHEFVTLRADDMIEVIKELVTKVIPNSRIVVVRNDTGCIIIDSLLKTDLADKLFYVVEDGEKKYGANLIVEHLDETHTNDDDLTSLNIAKAVAMVVTACCPTSESEGTTERNDVEIEVVNAKAPENIEKLIDTLEATITDEMDEFMENISSDIEIKDSEGNVVYPAQEPEIKYVDKFNYYYVKTADGSYTYYTQENTVYEAGIPEETILQLLATESVVKVEK